MPYRRRNYRRRRPYKRRPRPQPSRFYRWAGYARTGLSLAAQVAALTRMVNAEVKKRDTQLATPAPVDVTPSVIAISRVEQGDTDSTRSGNSIRLKSLLTRFQFVLNPSDANKSAQVRFVLLRDTQQISDTTPAWTDVFENLANPILAPLNNETVGRFSILKDFTFTLSEGTTESKMIKTFTKSGVHIRFNGPDLVDIQKNGFYVMIASNATEALPVNYTYFTRMSFYDN